MELLLLATITPRPGERNADRDATGIASASS
jgi:hypothetical protein